jgi:hypothetical protein
MPSLFYSPPVSITCCSHTDLTILLGNCRTFEGSTFAGVIKALAICLSFFVLCPLFNYQSLIIFMGICLPMAKLLTLLDVYLAVSKKKDALVTR